MSAKNYSKSCLTKIFKASEVKFLNNLNYWLSNKNDYGIQKFGWKWIYNTLDQWAKQTKLSKISIRRAIENLKKQNIIFVEYLSQNKRDRTLFYSINYKKLDDILNGSYALESKEKIQNEHLNEHMYNKENNNKINKSYKSPDNFSQKSSKVSEIVVSVSDSEKPKNTTVQDMIKAFHEEFSDVQINLDKNLARNLVAAFKLKFEGSLEKWKHFLKLIKTSTYLMSEKFKLTLRWLLKFSTIDRLRLGELGVKIKEFFTMVSDEEWQSRAEKQISKTDEPEEIKIIRKKIASKISPAKYMAWFKNVNFLQKDGILELIYPNRFVEDIIKTKFSENFNELISCI